MNTIWRMFWREREAVHPRVGAVLYEAAVQGAIKVGWESTAPLQI
jgi:hypothetical protein